MNRKFWKQKHDAYVGIKAINDLTKLIPNFAYTFGDYGRKLTKQMLLLNIYTERHYMIILKDLILDLMSIY